MHPRTGWAQARQITPVRSARWPFRPAPGRPGAGPGRGRRRGRPHPEATRGAGRTPPAAGRIVSAPLISVLLPAYDAAGTLAAALRSIARQSETRWECVLA